MVVNRDMLTMLYLEQNGKLTIFLIEDTTGKTLVFHVLVSFGIIMLFQTSRKKTS